MKPLPEALRAPITDLASGKAWLDALIDAQLVFHLEDDPGDIINIKSGKNILRRADVPLLRERQDQLYSLDWGPELECPIGYLFTREKDWN